MACVVCGGAIEEPRFANAWERARKLYPCCSPACAERFDPDVHWLPAAEPSAPGPEDESRLVRAASERMKAGDRPSIVVRDVLLAGVRPRAVRKLVITAELAVAAADRHVRRLNVLGIIRILLGGGWRTYERADRRDPQRLREASEDLERWERRFGIASGPNALPVAHVVDRGPRDPER